jgi:hypothetical protein
MSAMLYQKCPLCDGSLVLPEPLATNDGKTTDRCPCAESAEPGWAQVGVTQAQLQRLALAQQCHQADIAAVEALIAELAAVLRGLLGLWPLSGYELEAYCDATLIPAARAALAKC